jgi:hypothetical protein
MIRFIAQTLSFLSFLCVVCAAYTGMSGAPLSCVEWTSSAILFAIGSASFGKVQKR